MVAVALLRLAMPTQGVFQKIHPEGRLRAVTDASTQHPQGVSVDHRVPVGLAALQTHVSDKGTPNLIGTHYWHARQQIRLHIVL